MQPTTSPPSPPRLRALFTMAAVVLTLAACSDDPLSPGSTPGTGAAVDHVTVTPEATLLEMGQVQVLRAAPTAADGRLLVGRQVAWSSSDPAVASVDAQGAVTARQAGAVWISASSGGRSGRARIEVFTPFVSVASVQIEPDSVVLQVGGIRKIRALARAADGSVLSDRHVVWSGGDPAVASLDVDGNVIARGVGTTWVVATIEGRTSRAKVTVRPATELHLRSAAGSTLPAEVYAGSYTLPDGAVRQVRGTVTDGFLWLTDDGRYRISVMRVTYEDGVQKGSNAFYDHGTYTRSATGELAFQSDFMVNRFTGRETGTGLSLLQNVYMDAAPVRFIWEWQQ